MKMILFSGFVFSLAVFAADGVRAPAPKSDSQTLLERELAKFDKNKDGRIDAEKRGACLAAQAKRREDHIKR